MRMTVFKILPHHPRPLGEVKGEIFKFSNNSVSCQFFFTEISHADRGRINMKHIKQDNVEGLGPTPWVDLGHGAEA